MFIGRLLRISISQKPCPEFRDCIFKRKRHRAGYPARFGRYKNPRLWKFKNGHVISWQQRDVNRPPDPVL